MRRFTLQFVGVSFTLACSVIVLGFAAASEPTDYDLVIVAGQSNAVGFDAVPDELPENSNDEKVLLWWKVGDPPPDEHDSTSASRWVTLRPQPLGDPAAKDSAPRQYGNFAQPEGGFGPEIGFARELLKVSPDRKLAILKVAFSGTSIPQDWDPDRRSDPTSCYQALTTELDKARVAAAKRQIGLHVKALLWVQGESDANAVNAPRYADDLTKLIRSLRRDFSAQEMKALIAVNTRFNNGTNRFMPMIVAAQKQVAAADPNVVYIDTSSATIANRAHYDTAGTISVGRWFAQGLMKLEPHERP